MLCHANVVAMPQVVFDRILTLERLRLRTLLAYNYHRVLVVSVFVDELGFVRRSDRVYVDVDADSHLARRNDEPE
jgi:hypothetical protein